MLATFLADDLFLYLLAFARIGSTLMVLPGIGAATVSPRIRLLLALTTTFVVLPVVSPSLPPMPATVLNLTLLLAGEVIIGLFIGYVARLMLTALEVAGTVVATTSSLANAAIFNPAAAEQSPVISTFLVLAGMLLIFVTDLHHLMLMAVVESYDVFVPATGLPVGDMADSITRLVSRSFVVGIQLAAPFIVVAMVFQICIGLIARLMPQLMIFFIAIPVQIALGFIVLTAVLSALLLVWLGTFQDGIVTYLAM